MISIRSVLAPLNIKSARALEDVTHSADFTGVPDNSLRRQASRAFFIQYHERVGKFNGPLGIPMGDLRPLGSGSAKPYSGGVVDLLDFTDGPQGFHRHRAEVRFVGFRCGAESEGGDGDEPYFIIGILGTNDDPGVTMLFPRNGTFSAVHTGRNTFIEEVVTLTAQPPFTISVTAMDHDSGSPDEASAKVEKTLQSAAAKANLALTLFGVNPGIGAMTQSLVDIFGGTVADGLSALFGMGDDLIGNNAFHLFDYDKQQDQWLTPKPRTSPDFDKPFNVELVLDNGEGGAYSAFLQVDLFTDTVVPAPKEK